MKDQITRTSYRAAYRYIIAPENGCSATYGKEAPAQWKDQIWQYGSNLGQGDPDPLWNQLGRHSAWGGTSVPGNWPHRSE
ncbi:hypothetical protein [Dyadobacter sp. 32]|uniref:hypothetical protein n=1 Tax=Dyadobacter sp. 32 TaxID=538966 RepID=UPI0011ED3D9A